jgi:hypothetical protein
MKKILNLILLLTVQSSLLMAQSSDVAMADKFRADGKIYVVIAVMTVLFSGMLTYVILLDRKLTKLEKELKEK